MPRNEIPLYILLTTALTALAYRQRNSRAKVPRIEAGLKDGFCGHNEIFITRLPIIQGDATSWGTLLHLFHEQDAPVTLQGNRLASPKESWKDLTTIDVHKQTNGTGVTISRTTLIALLILSNARIIYEYSDSSGYRAALGSWTGQWYITWRAGQEAIVSLKPHDSHSPASDVYPPCFPARVDRCVQMMAGVILNASAPHSFSVAFPGRLAPGRYRLEHQPKGFGLSHGSRHIYNMNGGKVFEIDFLFPRPMEDGDEDEKLCLRLPSLEADRPVWLYIPAQVHVILAEAMDRLPWGNLSWSVHRGMRDVLLAFARRTMNDHRQALAQTLRDAAHRYHAQLSKAGWDISFAKSYMAEMAASAVLAGRGNSGDAVRIVTALAEQVHGGNVAQRDETIFWREPQQKPGDGILGRDAIVALVKCFVLEWSVDFNYQIYHQLPITLQLR